MDNKLFDIIDARCNHEDVRSDFVGKLKEIYHLEDISRNWRIKLENNIKMYLTSDGMACTGFL